MKGSPSHKQQWYSYLILEILCSMKNYWGGTSRVTKRILEDLHDNGFLRVSRREKGIKLYEVITGWEEVEVSPEQRYARLAITTAHVFGPTTKSFPIFELKALKNLIPKRNERLKIIDQLVTSDQLAEVSMEGVTYLWIHDNFQSNEVSERVRIVSPFDPLVRDRQRFEQVWGWRYRFEAYVPAKQRERGYYSMPLLWRENVIGWTNAKVNKKRLEVNVGFVDKPPLGKAFRSAIEAEIESMTIFLGLDSGSWQLNMNSNR